MDVGIEQLVDESRDNLRGPTARRLADEVESLRAAIERVLTLCANNTDVCSCTHSEALILPSQVLAALDGARLGTANHADQNDTSDVSVPGDAGQSTVPD